MVLNAILCTGEQWESWTYGQHVDENLKKAKLQNKKNWKDCLMIVLHGYQLRYLSGGCSLFDLMYERRSSLPSDPICPATNPDYQNGRFWKLLRAEKDCFKRTFLTPWLQDKKASNLGEKVLVV